MTAALYVHLRGLEAEIEHIKYCLKKPDSDEFLQYLQQRKNILQQQIKDEEYVQVSKIPRN